MKRLILRLIGLYFIPFIVIFSFATIANAQSAIAQKIGPFSRHEIDIGGNQRATYYLSTARQSAPLIMIIGGSGCTPIFTTDSQGRKILSIFGAWEIASAGSANVLLIEKQFAGEGPNSVPGSAEHCSQKFNENFTAENWLHILSQALLDARKQNNIDPSKTLIFGVSEGAVMAAMLAKKHDFITHIALWGATGTSQALDFLANAYQSGQNDEERLLSIEEVEKGIAQINQSPNAADKFIWGHPYKRWSSFFNIAVDNELLAGKSKNYFLIGMQDKSVPPISTEVAVARLIAAGRNVTVRRLPDVGHSMLKEGQSFEALDGELKRVLDWFDAN